MRTARSSTSAGEEKGARDDGAQVVVDALAGNASEPLEGADVALEKRLDGHVEGKVGGLGAGEGQTGDERVDSALAALKPWPRRHLGPVELEHLRRPVARALGGAHLARAQLGEPPADKVDRVLIAVLRRSSVIRGALICDQS